MESTKFLIYYCDQVLPHWDEIGKLNDGSTLQYQFLKQLTELSAHCGKLENPSLHVVQIFDKLKVGHYFIYLFFINNWLSKGSNNINLILIILFE